MSPRKDANPPTPPSGGQPPAGGAVGDAESLLRGNRFTGRRWRRVELPDGASCGVYGADSCEAGTSFQIGGLLLIYVLSGPQEASWDDGSGRRHHRNPVRSRDCFLWDATQRIHLEFSSRLECVVVQLSPAFLDPLRQARGLPAPSGVIRPRSQFRDPLVESLCLKVRSEIDHHSGANPVVLEAVARVLAAHVLDAFMEPRRAEVAAGTGVRRDASPRGLSDHQLGAVKRHVDQELAGEISLESMAKVACLSPYHFLRSFRESVGKTPHQYLIERRVETARAMLESRDPSLTLAQVAVDCGFSDQSHLSKYFRKLVGRTPGEYLRTTRARR